jgi:hypothetical protein
MKTETINQLAEHYEIVYNLKASAKAEFNANLVQLFENNPTLLKFKIRINNHEFNDGDATNFSLYYEDLEVTDIDLNVFERNDYGCNDPERNRSHPLVKVVYDLFEKYDTADLHEYIFGDEYDSYLEISRNNVSDYTE